MRYKKLDNVQGAVKIFEQKLYDKFDESARNIVKRQLKEFVKDNPDKYGEDLVYDDPLIQNECKFIEVQVYGKWDDVLFPYSYPFVYARKMRFSPETLFIGFNKSLTSAVLFSRKSIIEKPTRLKKYARELVNIVQWKNVMKIPAIRLNIDAIRSYFGVEIEREIPEIIKIVDEVKLLYLDDNDDYTIVKRVEKLINNLI